MESLPVARVTNFLIFGQEGHTGLLNLRIGNALSLIGSLRLFNGNSFAGVRLHGSELDFG